MYGNEEHEGLSDHVSDDDSDCNDMISAKLKRMRERIDWNVEEQRHDLLQQLCSLTIDWWTGSFPNLLDVFRREEIDWLLMTNVQNIAEPLGVSKFVKFVARSGYKDEPDLDEDSGKPLTRRTTALHRASRRDFWTCRMIIELFEIYDRFDVNYTDEFGLTHFHVACEYGLYDVVQKFLELGRVDPNCLEYVTGDSPLHLAVAEKLLDLLIDTGYKDEPDVDQDGKPLWRRSTAVHAIRGRYSLHESVVHKLFKIYDRFDVNYTDEDGLTHFHVACGYGLCDVVQKFLELGQNPNLFENCDSKSPLYIAVLSGHKDVALLLLKNGADPNLANELGSTILHILCNGYYDVELLKMLFDICDELNQTLQIEAKDKFGRTPLQWAVARLLPNIVDILLYHGADLASFVFPAESDFISRIVPDALLVAEHLEKRGYELDRSDALTIMKISTRSTSLKKPLYRVKCSRNEFQMSSDEAKLFTAFCGKWALNSFLELTRYQLPILCCELIIRNLMNEDLFHICSAAEDQSHEDSKKIVETNGAQCINKRPARARKAPQRLQIVW
uniref:Uncharacterized protein n=1 Tax=Trichogramma kaykai TaxID=54128 RepID=A0ABD2WIZ2_9HYME